MLKSVGLILLIMVVGLHTVRPDQRDVVGLAGVGALLFVLLHDRWQARRANAGYVYLIHDPATGETKIGMTRREPTARLGELTKGPRALELIHAIPARDARDAERRLHERYRHKRGRGEWHMLSSRDIADLKRIRGM